MPGVRRAGATGLTQHIMTQQSRSRRLATGRIDTRAAF
jgi:hypothetical protein